MVTDLDKQAIDLLGLKNANVITEMVEQWIFTDYLQNENAFLALCVSKSDETITYVSDWCSDSFDLSIFDSLAKTALSSFAKVIKDYKMRERGMSYMHCALNIEGLDILGGDAQKLEMATIWLEQLTIYSFALCDKNMSQEEVKSLLFEFNYAICRTLAPKSNKAWDLVDYILSRVDLKLENRPGYEKNLIRHAERAFCCNLFPSIKAWKK